MGQIDDHYKKVAQQAAQDEEAKGVALYNRYVAIVNEQLDAIMARLRAGHLPETCDWVYDGDNQLACWRISKEYDGKYSYDLLAEECTLVRTVQRDYRDFTVVHRLGRPRAVQSVEEGNRAENGYLSVGDLLDMARGLMGLNFIFGVPDAQERFDRHCIDLYGRGGRCGFLSR